MSKTKNKRILWAAVILLAVVLGGLGLCYVLDPYGFRMADGLSIGGVEVGGMTPFQAADALETALEESLYREDLTVILPQETIVLSPAETNVQLSIPKVLWDAYRCGRFDEWEAVRELLLLPYMTWDEDYIRGRLTDYAAKYDTELVQHQWELTGTRPELSTDGFDETAPCQVLTLTMGTPALHMDVSEVYGNVLAAYNQAISACAAGEFTVTPEVQPEQLPETWDWDAIWEEITVDAVDDSLDMENYKTVSGSYGYGFDLEAAREWAGRAGSGETLELSMAYIAPDILGDGVYFRDVLGSCETRHTDDENRNTNLRLLCAALDGVILQPGEEFSYNGTVGERTEEKGYKPATAYSGSRITKDIGGGVCQGSTTLYNCALLADLEILERVCHGATVGYIDLGLDAAVNWNTKTDLRFRNNFHFPMMIRAEVADGYVKMQILGTDEKDYYIEMHTGRGEEGDILYAVSRKYKYSKETGELLSKDIEARSTYYPLS